MVAREFTTTQGRKIELLGVSTAVHIYIDGKFYRVVSGLNNAKSVAIRHSQRHGQKNSA